WRVALWRVAAAGVALVAVLSLAPPIVTYPLLPRVPAPVEVQPTDRAQESRPPASLTILPPPLLQPAIVRQVAMVPPRASQRAPAPAAHQAGRHDTRPVADPHRAEPVRSDVQDVRWKRRVGLWLLPIWLTGVIALMIRFMVGNLYLFRLVRR